MRLSNLNQIPAEFRCRDQLQQYAAPKKYGLYLWTLKDRKARQPVFDRQYGDFLDYHKRIQQRKAKLEAETKARNEKARMAAQKTLRESLADE